MKFMKIGTAFFFVFLSVLLHGSNRCPVDAIGYPAAAVGAGISHGVGGFGSLSFGNLLSAFLPGHLGILGPIKLALMSKLGLALGIVGTALGGSALGIALKNDEHRNNDYNDYDSYSSYSSYGNYDNNYGNHWGHHHGGYRKKRDTEELLDAQKEENFDFVYKADKNKCTEKLICDLAHKFTFSKTSLKMDEFSILLMVKSKPRSSNMRSKAHLLFEKALRRGINGSSCKALYSSCQFNGDHLMSMIRLFSSPFNGLSTEKVISYIRS